MKYARTVRLPRPGPRIGVLAWGLFCAACQLGTSLDGYTTSQDASPEIAVEADADVLSDTGAGGSAEGGSAGAGGGLAEGGSAGAGAGGGSAEGGSAGVGGGGGDECTPTGSVADLRAKIKGSELDKVVTEEFQLCGVVVTYVNKTEGFYLQDPGADDKDGILAFIKVADAPDANLGNKLNVKVTQYKRHKTGGDSAAGEGLLEIVQADLTKLDETVDVSTLVQELKAAPTEDFAAELVSVKDLEITESKKAGRNNWSLKVKYGSATDVVLYLYGYDDTAPKAFCKGKKIGTYQGPVGYFSKNYQLVSDHPADDLKDVTGECK